jgi:hypothetical protein
MGHRNQREVGPRNAVRQRSIHQTIARPPGTRAWRTVLLAVALIVLLTPSCDGGGKRELSMDEAIEHGRRCLQPVIEARTGSLQIEVGALNNCFARLMSDEQGRHYLLGVGNAALVNWGRDVATEIGASLPADPLSGLGGAVKDASQDLLIRDEVNDLEVLYGSLIRGLRANIKQSHDAAAELSGVLGFLDEQAAQPVSGRSELAAAGERYVREPLGRQVRSSIKQKNADAAKFKADANFLKNEIRNHLEDMLAVLLWAEVRVRSRLVTGPFPPGAVPGSPPPTEADGKPINPPLETPEHVLLVPDDSEPGARHKAFFDWLERGGGSELHAATLGVLQHTDLDRKLRGLAEQLFSED